MRGVAGGTLLALVLALVVGLLMLHRKSGNAGEQQAADVFAADREAAVEPAAFDAKRAMNYLEAVCKIGPRISGSEGMRKQQDLLEKHFKAHGAQVTRQDFKARQRSKNEPVAMTNLIASWHPERKRRVILCSHYDTRPLADQEHDTRRWRQPFISANDGGSGVALLMELAHHVKDLKLAVGVDFVFFDGEEYVYDKDDEYFFGSKHFGREYRRASDEKRYAGAILLDMIGGKGARFPVEQTSWRMAPAFVKVVWGIANELKCPAFDSSALSHVPVQDDHVPLNQAGIPTIDIIDFKYPHWHRLSDLPENCSGDSLEQVARVLSVWLQRVK